MRLKHSLPLLFLGAGLGLALLPATPPRAATQAAETGAEPPPGAPVEAPPEEETRSIAYSVTLPETGDAALDEAIRRASALERLRESAPVDTYGLIGRAIAESDHLRDALRSEGYYGGRFAVLVEGTPPETPGLATRLQSRPAGATPVAVAVTVVPGPRYTLAAPRLVAEPAGTALPDGLSQALPGAGLAAGAPARAQPVLDAEARITTALREAGHPFASLRRRVLVDHDARVLEVTFLIAPGPRAQFARPRVIGTGPAAGTAPGGSETRTETRTDARTDAGLLGRIVAPLEGETYRPAKLEEARRNLLSLDVFSTVRARAAERLDESGRLPVTFTVIERPLRAIGFSAAYETRYGPTFSTYWEHRNLLGGAEKLRLEAEVNRLGTTGDTSDTGGRLAASLKTPWFAGRNQTLSLDTAALRERPDAYDRDAFTLGATLERSLSPRLALSAGPQVEFSRVTQDGETTSYQLLGLLGTLRWTDVDNPLNPSRGLRGTLLVNPIYSLGESNAFTRLRAQASTYLDLSGDQGSILALRGAVGSILGASFGGVPPDKRFYSGGGGSVRGYSYQSVGPRTAAAEPAGGLSQVEATLELRQRVSGPWGMAVFVDAGSVTRDPMPDFGNLRFGAGLGLRYLTGIGPLRADIALPLNRESGDSAFGLYLGIGQAF
ncbi:BamA/TamA family outer membrane protein [Roseomonas sp. GC11]|uniref:autotransporter assembly complex protein TamA n=1 Tax=Roseomonas sp. GC11 TaxID=2950546 RepID=UPI00210B248D|nr:BamA/TamA family outer membrane protein [Roseomonas sp. GC11]MCQ4162511.1 BamA/TamA family outer membrane protein [Roseomonas sp. GC11]